MFLKQDLFPVMCLEYPLSRYHFISFWWCNLRHTYIGNSSHFRYPYLFGSFWVSYLVRLFHLLFFCFFSRKTFFRIVSLLKIIYTYRNFILRIFGWFLIIFFLKSKSYFIKIWPLTTKYQI